jgi:hypothetical protein
MNDAAPDQAVAHKVTSDPSPKNGAAAPQATKANGVVHTDGGNSVIAGFQELTKAYHSLASENAEKLTASLQAFVAVKTPLEFAELQRRLIAESVASALSNYNNIASLTAAAFAAPFEALRKQGTPRT